MGFTSGTGLLAQRKRMTYDVDLSPDELDYLKFLVDKDAEWFERGNKGKYLYSLLVPTLLQLKIKLDKTKRDKL